MQGQKVKEDISNYLPVNTV